MPNQLINTILEAEDIQALQVDFSQLKKIPRENAASMQVIIYYKDEENWVYVLTTNNHPEDLKKIDDVALANASTEVKEEEE